MLYSRYLLDLLTLCSFNKIYNIESINSVYRFTSCVRQLAAKKIIRSTSVEFAEVRIQITNLHNALRGLIFTMGLDVIV